MRYKLPLIGGHVSTAGGLHKGIENGAAITAECIQIFGSSPRQWSTHIPTPDEIQQFKDYQQKYTIHDVYLHASYLVNLASPNPESRNWSIKNLSDHLRIAELIGAKGLIFHIGSGKELPKEEVMDFVIEGMKQVLAHVPGDTFLIMENSASSKKIGAYAHEIGMLLRGAGEARIKVCIDTAHAFEAGIIMAYTPELVKEFCDSWEKEVGLEHVVALHVNDSKTVWNSQHDKHENIGEGYIGIEGFQALAHEPRLYDKAWLLEVPGKEKAGPDKENIDRLKSCFPS